MVCQPSGLRERSKVLTGRFPPSSQGSKEFPSDVAAPTVSENRPDAMTEQKRPRALTYTEMMNGGRQRIDEQPSTVPALRKLGPELTINGKTIALSAPSDVAIAQRVAGHLLRRIEEDDWRPYKNKEEAVAAWSKLGGIRAKVMDALGLT